MRCLFMPLHSSPPPSYVLTARTEVLEEYRTQKNTQPLVDSGAIGPFHYKVLFEEFLDWDDEDDNECDNDDNIE
jgi:hypothetical protein